MATEPKTIRESNLALAGLESRVGLLQLMVWAVIGLLGTLIAGAFALYSQLGEIKTDVAVLKTNLQTIKEQQSAIQESLRSLDSKSQASLARIDASVRDFSARVQAVAVAPVAAGPLIFSSELAGIIKTFISPQRTDKPLQFKVGMDLAESTSLRPLPRPLLEKIPDLASYSYTYDVSGAVLLVSNLTRKVVQVIEAT